MAGSSKAYDFTGEFIYQQIKNQPWYRAHANTVTTAAGFLVTLVGWLASQQWAQHDTRVQAAVWVAGFLATIVGVKNTPNGWSPSQLARINQARAEYMDDHCDHAAQETPSVPQQTPAAPVDTVGADTSLEEQINAFNTRLDE